MHELQMTIDGDYETTADYAIRELLAPFPSTMESRRLVRQAILAHPETHAFLTNACPITDYDPLRDLLGNYLDALPAMESICRAVRKYKEDPDAKPAHSGNGSRSILHEDLAPVKWYRLYLTTKHWRCLQRSARDYYGGCVLCPKWDGKLEVHHRHYDTVGSELIRDLSVLCDEHHKAVSGFLGLSVPVDVPDGVRHIFKKEGIQWF